MAATPGGHQNCVGPRSVATADVMCYFCDEKGHYKSDCLERKAWEKLKKFHAALAVGCDSDNEGLAAF